MTTRARRPARRRQRPRRRLLRSGGGAGAHLRPRRHGATTTCLLPARLPSLVPQNVAKNQDLRRDQPEHGRDEFRLVRMERSKSRSSPPAFCSGRFRCTTSPALLADDGHLFLPLASLASRAGECGQRSEASWAPGK